MSLKNPYGLTLSLGGDHDVGLGIDHQDFASTHENYNPYYSSSLPLEMDMNYGTSTSSSYDHEFNTQALRNFSGNYSGLFEVPQNHLPELPSLASTKPRSRIRDSAVLRSQQGFSVPEPPAPQPQSTAEDDMQYSNEPEEPQLGGNNAGNGNMPILKLNHFVHNGYKYDGDVFELRPPQERSCNSRPERILQHKPAVLNHRQIFNRVYSEGTYNNRPSSLRQARLSIQSWNSLNLDLPLSPLSPQDLHDENNDIPFIPSIGTNSNRNSTNSAKRVSLLVENALVTKEQAMRIKIASPGAPPAQRAPRLVNHIVPQISFDEQLRAAVAEEQEKSFAHRKQPTGNINSQTQPAEVAAGGHKKKSKKSKQQQQKIPVQGEAATGKIKAMPPNKENQAPTKSTSGKRRNKKSNSNNNNSNTNSSKRKVSMESAERIRATPHITASKSKSGRSIAKKKERRVAAAAEAPSTPKPIIDSNGAPLNHHNSLGDDSASRGILSFNNETLQSSADGKIRCNNNNIIISSSTSKEGRKHRKNKESKKSTSKNQADNNNNPGAASGGNGTKKTRKGFWKNLGMK